MAVTQLFISEETRVANVNFFSGVNNSNTNSLSCKMFINILRGSRISRVNKTQNIYILGEKEKRKLNLHVDQRLYIEKRAME
jgi:hypothetical protein